MRVNVYSSETTGEVLGIHKDTPSGVRYHGAQIILHSPAQLAFAEEDRSAVTFWFEDKKKRNEFASAVALTINQTEDEK